MGWDNLLYKLLQRSQDKAWDVVIALGRLLMHLMGRGLESNKGKKNWCSDQTYMGVREDKPQERNRKLFFRSRKIGQWLECTRNQGKCAGIHKWVAERQSGHSAIGWSIRGQLGRYIREMRTGGILQQKNNIGERRVVRATPLIKID